MYIYNFHEIKILRGKATNRIFRLSVNTCLFERTSAILFKLRLIRFALRSGDEDHAIKPLRT